MSPVPLDALGRQCDADFGPGLLQRFRSAEKTWCAPHADAGPRPTEFTCRGVRYKDTPANDPDVQLCTATNLRLDTSKIAVAPGGEAIEAVRGQAESREFVRWSSGALSGDCTPTAAPRLKYAEQRSVLEAFKPRHSAAGSDGCDVTLPGTTLLVTRFEYANWYHVATDFVNAFIAAEALGVRPEDTRVLILDGHPISPFDSFWTTVMAPAQEELLRVGRLKGTVCFERAAFVPLGYESPLALNWNRPDPCPGSRLLKAFAHRTLAAYGVLDEPLPTRPTISFVFREDYMAHPRESDGKRRNKIANEDDLLALAKSGSDVEARSAHLASLPFAEQLRLIRRTNILVGMHGAGLTHTLFLPDEAVLLEMFPTHVSTKKHFRNLAGWMGHPYLPWQNKDGRNELDAFTTRVDVDAFRPVLDAAVRIARNFGSNNGYCGLVC